MTRTALKHTCEPADERAMLSLPAPSRRDIDRQGTAADDRGTKSHSDDPDSLSYADDPVNAHNKAQTNSAETAASGIRIEVRAGVASTTDTKRSRLRLPTAPEAALAVVTTLVVTIVVSAPTDPDLFWHLATGRHIAATKAIPYGDPFSWTVPGRAWIAHEWLAELVMYPIFRLGGMPALGLLFGSIVAVAIVATFAAARRRGASAWPSVGAASAVGLCASHTFASRPQMISLAFTAVFGWLLADFDKLPTGKAQRRLLQAAVLLIPWVNLHGGYIFGVALVGLCVAVKSLQALRSSGAREAVRLWPAGLLCLGAVLVNPNTVDGLIYPFTYLGDNASTRYVAEWVRPTLSNPQYWPLFFLVVLVLFAFGRSVLLRDRHAEKQSARRPRPSEWVLAVAFTVLAVTAVRNSGPFAVICAPMVAALLSPLGNQAQSVSSRRPHATRQLGSRSQGVVHLLLIAIAVTATVPSALWGVRASRFESSLDPEFPVTETAALRELGPDVRMFNAYDWGGYLIWTLHPQGVYVDGRPDMYGDAYVDRFIQTWSATPGWQQRLDHPRVNVVLVESRSGLGRAIATSPEWRVVRRTPAAILAVRRLSAPDLVERARPAGASVVGRSPANGSDRQSP